MAILDWQKLNLPAHFRAIDPASFGISKGEYARQYVDENEELVSIPIENSFVFMDDSERSFIFGYTYIISDPEVRQAFLDGIVPPDDEFYSPAEEITDTNIGDMSGGFSVLLSADERIDSMEFLMDDVAASVYLRYPEGQPPPVDVVHVAQVYVDSLIDPQPRCEFVSITPVEDSQWPAYDIEAIGFFPKERRIIELSGNVQKGNEIFSALSSMAGQTGESADEEGKINDRITFNVFDDAELSPTFGAYSLTVTGGFSGCVVNETVSWIDPGAEPAAEGFITYLLPGWGSLDIPEDWHVIHSPQPGLLLISSKDAGSVEETSDEDALLQIRQVDTQGWLPINIIREDYLPYLDYDIEPVREPEALTINGQEAATTTYHGYEDFMEQMTIYQSQDGSRTAYLLAVIGEKKWPEYEAIFETIRDSVRLSPVIEGPELLPEREIPHEYVWYTDKEQGYHVAYPESWQQADNVVNGVLYNISISPAALEKQQEVKQLIGSVSIYPPSTYIIGEEMPGSGYTARGQIDALWDWGGTAAIEDAMMTSSLSETNSNGTEYAAAYFVATDKTNNGSPIFGFMGAVTDGDKVVKMISWFDNPQEYQEVWLNIFNTIHFSE